MRLSIHARTHAYKQKGTHGTRNTEREDGKSSQYPAVHGLETVTDVRERTAEQYGHGVRHVRLRGLLVQLHRQNPLFDRRSTAAALPATGPAGCRRVPIFATVTAARAEGAHGTRGEGRGIERRGREEAEGGRGRGGGSAAAVGSAEDGGRGAA